ncbi:unnamed protein product [Darwinula stevensoni]|uniref:Uncharacterized protein n=1 Tax=Darwinula stevensoni TaxID=69355 RepID=A0A7R9AFG3_9CRUS|nr:unnamed protein product [Darwinula stevensoni]CAG0903027.1 unnamed protein product [Darwinula stevensoni]
MLVRESLRRQLFEDTNAMNRACKASLLDLAKEDKPPGFRCLPPRGRILVVCHSISFIGCMAIVADGVNWTAWKEGRRSEFISEETLNKIPIVSIVYSLVRIGMDSLLVHGIRKELGNMARPGDKTFHHQENLLFNTLQPSAPIHPQ